MSSRAIDKKHHEIEDNIRDSFQVKNIIIPFSFFFRTHESYIYSGEEKIPFRKRHPLYKIVMLNEFRE